MKSEVQNNLKSEKEYENIKLILYFYILANAS